MPRMLGNEQYQYSCRSHQLFQDGCRFRIHLYERILYANQKTQARIQSQFDTENPCIASYSLHQTTGASACWLPHLEKTRQRLDRLPYKVVANSDYGNQENYTYLEEHQIEAYVKYGFFIVNKDNGLRSMSEKSSG